MGRKATAKKHRRDSVSDPEQRAAPDGAKPSGGASKPVHLSDATFDGTVGRSEIPVLVDFWAPWCGPCKMIAPVLEEVARNYAGKILVAKYNTEANQQIAQAMNIRSIPALVLFKNGEVADVQIGAIGQARLEAWIERTIAPRRSLLDRLLGRPAPEEL